MKAHQYAAEACKNLKELYKTLPLDVFLRIATRPVDQLKTSAKTKDTAEEDEAKMSKGKGKGKKSQVKRTAEEI